MRSVRPSAATTPQTHLCGSGNPPRSYRSRDPLRVVTEVTGWPRHSPEELEGMLTGLARLRAQGLDVVYD